MLVCPSCGENMQLNMNAEPVFYECSDCGYKYRFDPEPEDYEHLYVDIGGEG
jgi:Zn ribbon nucleic-acid-binding protein